MPHLDNFFGHNTVNKSGVVKFVPLPRDLTYANTQLPSKPTSPEADAAVRVSNNFQYVVPSLIPPPPPPPVKSKVPATGNNGSGGSDTRGMTATEALAQAKYNYDKEQDAKKLASFQNYYDSGSYNTGFDALLKMITDQGTISETGVTNAYGRAKTNLDEGFTAAQGLGNTGYAALNKYLLQNPNNPYAGMKATVGGSPDAMSNYLKAYGVSDLPVQGQIQADQLQAQQGAGNYQNLIDVLGAVAKQGASSRGAESAMGQNLFNTSLGQDKAGYQGQASNAQAQALAALQQQMFQSQYGVANDRNNLANQIAQALAIAGGDSTKTGTEAAAAAAAKKKKEEEDAAAAAALLAKGNPPLTIEQLLKQIAERQAAGTGNYGGSGGGYGVAPGMGQYAI